MANSNYATSKKVRVSDPVLKRLLLEHLVENARKRKTKPETPLDFFIDDLGSRTYNEILMMSSRNLFDVEITLKQDRVTATRRSVEAQVEAEDLLRYFVRHGASRAMLCTFFRITRASVTKLRNEFHEGFKVGRPPIPSMEIRDEVQARWYHLGKTMPDAPVRDRVYALHQLFSEWQIHSLEAALREFPEIAKTLPLQSFRSKSDPSLAGRDDPFE